MVFKIFYPSWTYISWQIFISILFSVLRYGWSWSHPNFTVPVYKDKDPEEIKTALYKHKILSEVIPRAPKHFIQVTYTTDIAKNCSIGLGNVLNPNLMDCFPFQVQWPTENGTYYTLMMIDPDYPSRENRSQGAFLHWLLGNIPDSGEEYPMPDIFDCTLMTRYQGPKPAKGTGFHRYTFLVYKQKGKTRFKEPDIFIEPYDEHKRLHFSPRNFSNKYHLGKAYAIAFYLAEWVKPPLSTTYAPWDFTPETEGTDVGDWSVHDGDDDIKI